jgi:hypothetical protein
VLSAPPSWPVCLYPCSRNGLAYGPLARSVLKPRYPTTHAILIISQRVHALDALNGASSRSHTRIQAGGLRVWMRCCPLPLVPSGFERVLPPCPSPAELASGSPGDAPVSTDLCLSSITITRLVAHRSRRAVFPHRALQTYSLPQTLLTKRLGYTPQ